MSVKHASWLALLALGGAHAQSYPAKPVRIVTVETGGGADFASRVLSAALSEHFSQQFVVENRGGAGGAIAIELTAKSPPDGYTLMVQGSTLWLLPFLRKSASWDALRDFAPVSWVTRSPNLLLVHPSLPVKSVRSLADLAKSRPAEITYGSSGTGSSTHLAAALFVATAGINMVHVPYKGAGPSLNALAGGHVQMGFAFTGGAMPHVNAGRLRALAVSSATATPLAPGLPTIAETLPGYELVSTLGVVAPAGTPAAVISRASQGINAVLARQDIRERFFNAGAEAIGGTPESFTALIRADIARLGKVIRDAGIRDD